MASGSVRRRRGKRGTTYQVVIELGTVAGKRRQKTRTYKRRKDADDYLIKTLNELNTGVYIEPSTMPLCEYAPHWFDTIDVAPSSRLAYQGDYDRHIAPVFGDVALGAITVQQVQTWFNDKRRRYRSVLRMFMILQSILNQAVHQRLILTNPCADVITSERGTAHGGGVNSPWTAGQLATFLEATREDRDWPLWWLSAHTGMRPGELVALRWPDLDLDARTIHIRRTQTPVTRNGRRITGTVPKNLASDRVIGIDPETVLVLRGVRATQDQRRRVLSDRWQDDDLVFDRGDGQLYSADVASRRFTHAVECLQLPRLTLHGLRALHGSILARGGRPLHYIQHRLGHKNLATTSRYYLHLLPGTQTDDAEAFAAEMRAAKQANSGAM